MYLHIPPLNYKELYLYSEKRWEIIPLGSSTYDLAYPVTQNAPVIITSSGYLMNRTTDPWGQLSGEHKYQKVGYGDFSTLPGGGVDTTVKEFSLDPSSSGTIVFNAALSENVYVEYESGPSGYYIATSIDLNPMENQTDGGFVHISESKDPTSIHVSANKETIFAGGSEFVRITATLYDDNFDRVSGKGVIFLIADSLLGVLEPENGTVYSTDVDGYVVGVRAVTDGKGFAKAKYIPKNGQSGDAVIGAAWEGDTANVQNWVSVTQVYLVDNPFMLDVSMLDTWDYLT
jgi:hypothetical protein